jgi:hypothetical protein
VDVQRLARCCQNKKPPAAKPAVFLLPEFGVRALLRYIRGQSTILSPSRNTVAYAARQREHNVRLQERYIGSRRSNFSKMCSDPEVVL